MPLADKFIQFLRAQGGEVSGRLGNKPTIEVINSRGEAAFITFATRSQGAQAADDFILAGNEETPGYINHNGSSPT
jgi:hypothetical protein